MLFITYVCIGFQDLGIASPRLFFIGRTGSSLCIDDPRTEKEGEQIALKALIMKLTTPH
jgi:hypothetical protein